MRIAHTPEELPAGRRAVALGTFDGVHRGHRRVLDAARANDGLLSTAVTFPSVIEVMRVPLVPSKMVPGPVSTR